MLAPGAQVGVGVGVGGTGVGVAGTGVGVGGSGEGVGDGVGPRDRTRFTCDPTSTSVPAVGSLRMTVPSSWDDGACDTSPRFSPTAFKVAVASARVWPMRLGTGTVSAPLLTTTMISSPSLTRVPAGGIVLITVP